MKKIKNLWVENRVLFVLFIVVVVCLIIMFSVCINYFFGSSKSSYGDRLEGIETMQISEDLKNNFLNLLKEDTLIDDATFNVKGKIIYIVLNFKPDVTLVEAQSKALFSLMTFEQKYLDFYDFHYTLKSEKTDTNAGFLIMGAKNVNGSGLVWNNNTEVQIDGE